MDNIIEEEKLDSQKGDGINIKEFFYICMNKWHWFVSSLVIMLGLGVIYILKTPPTYTRYAEILIKDSKSLSGLEYSFTELGLVNNNSNVINESVSFQSPALMAEVVKRLKLNIDYKIDGVFHRKIAYGKSLPFIVEFIDIPENQSASFSINSINGKQIILSDFKLKEDDFDDQIECTVNDTIKTPIGRIFICNNPTWNKVENKNEENKDKNEYTFFVNHLPLHAATTSYLNKLTVELSDKDGTIIKLILNDGNIQRAEDVLSSMIAIYNENWIEDKNLIATSSAMFINERLKLIEQDLGIVDENISSYKSKNLIPDIQKASDIYLSQSSENNAQILELNNHLYMTKYIHEYLNDNKNKYNLLPANSGIGNRNIENQISEYNTKLLQRNSLIANSSLENPIIADMEIALQSMKRAILTSIENEEHTLNKQINSLTNVEKKTTSHIAASPAQAKYLLSVERQQKVKESLYVFLLERREENEISKAFTAYNTRLITPPYGSNIPTSPNRNKIFISTFILGIFIPGITIFLKGTLNTKIRGRKDLEKLTIPFIGEVPYIGKKKSKIFFFKEKEEKARPIVVKQDSRDIINEAFRVLRTNIEFITENNKTNVIIFSSFNPGSGKSFISGNLAMSLAIKNKKVVLIDGDLRHASTSEFINSPQIGISNYLSGKTDSINNIIAKNKLHENLDIIPVGTIPPNPTELLYSERLGILIKELKEKYDYIFIDCPPVELVADTQIIEKLADRMIFIVRAGLLERDMLSELQNSYSSKRYKNMSLILNGTESISNGRYGYRYGYGYGYGSGYQYSSKTEN